MTLSPQRALSQTSFEGNDLVIKKGTPAKFSGVLVPETLYRFYRAETDRSSQLDKEIIELDESVRRARSGGFHWSTQILVGIVLGAGAGYILSRPR